MISRAKLSNISNRPHLMRAHSLVLVDSKYRGKTIGYMPALCSLLHMHMDGADSDILMGAQSIILCANSSSVEQTARFCRNLLYSPNLPPPRVVHAVGSRDITSVTVSSLFFTATHYFSHFISSNSAKSTTGATF